MNRFVCNLFGLLALSWTFTLGDHARPGRSGDVSNYLTRDGKLRHALELDSAA